MCGETVSAVLNCGAQIQIGVKRNGRDLPMKSFRAVNDGKFWCLLHHRTLKRTDKVPHLQSSNPSKLGDQESVRDDQRGETWQEDTQRKEETHGPQRTFMLNSLRKERTQMDEKRETVSTEQLRDCRRAAR